MIQWKQTQRKLEDQIAALGGRARKLDASDVAEALKLARRLVRRPSSAHTLRISARGGYVPNSYGYRAEADAFEIVFTRAEDGAWRLASAEARRERAQSRAHGDGPRLIARAIHAGQRDGSIVYRA